MIIDIEANKVAFLICSNVIGGHEYQSAAFAKSLSKYAKVTVIVNNIEHAKLFEELNLDVILKKGLLLRSGALWRQVLDGLLRRNAIRAATDGFHHVLICCGAVEAGVATGIALSGYQPITMYLPFFYDRVPVWGLIGHIYNCVLAKFCKLFERIVTINKLQAKIIGGFSGVKTFVVKNKIRDVKPGLEADIPRLIFIGRLDAQKRIGELILSLDNNLNPIKTMLIIGDGPLRSQLEMMSKNLKFLNCIFMGWQSANEQDILIHRSDILILNSLLEGEPLVIREARKRSMRVLVREILGTRGITFPRERFKTYNELNTKLLVYYNEEISHHYNFRCVNSNDSDVSRDRDIFKIVQTIFHF